MLILYKCLYYALLGLLSILGLWCILLFGSFLLIFANPFMWLFLGAMSKERWEKFFGFYIWSSVITLFGAPNIAILLIMGIIYFGERIGAV